MSTDDDQAAPSSAPDPAPAGEPAAAPPAPEAAEPGAPKDPLDEARAELSRLRDQLLRTAADFDNFRKRSRREVEDAQKRGREDLLRDMLPVFDNLERAAQSAEKAPDAKAVADGVRMVLKQFLDALSRAGIRRIETLGLPFDPTQHEAIQQVESADQPPGTIVAEVQPGYALGERLVRAAMVVVAKPPATDGGDPPAGAEPN